MKSIYCTLKPAVLLAALTLATMVHANDKLTVLHAFQGGTTGTGNPAFQLAADSAGNLYGTTFWGGNFAGCKNQGCGVVYRLSPNGSQWTYTVLYKFPGYTGGTEPYNVILDSAGNLYGELAQGGTFGNGLVFELSPTTSGPWKFTSLYEFTGGTDGGLPNGGLVFDAAGNLYGATHYGGKGSGAGTVFELSPASGGGWTETVLYDFFSGQCFGTYNPNAGVVFDAAGNLYGTSAGGNGAVYELKAGSGGRTCVLLYAFQGIDGAVPEAGVTLDAAGNIYGTTVAGGVNSAGTVFELSPNSSGSYTFNLVFAFNGSSGQNPYYPVLVDASGDIYGAALYGTSNWGVVFKLSHAAGGWTYGLLHTFTGAADGGYPNGLIFDSAGNLYGVANYGAKAGCINQSGCGTVFKLSPATAVEHR
jgi:uncharacterized repeat protein (TIGR03803 family)